MMRPRLRLAATLLMLGSAGGVRAQGLVILAHGPGAAAHPIGSTLAPGSALAPGDRIDVLERGGTRRLDGPTVYAPLARSTAADNARLVVAQLMDRQREMRAATQPPDVRHRPGSVRGMTVATADAATREEARARYAGGVWAVDATRAGATCFPAGTVPHIWRPPAPDPVAATLTPVDGGAALPVAWPAGSDRAAWPAPLPAVPSDYLLRAAGGMPTRVRLVPLAATATLDALVIALDAAGCAAQLGYLLDHYPDDAPPAR